MNNLQTAVNAVVLWRGLQWFTFRLTEPECKGKGLTLPIPLLASELKCQKVVTYHWVAELSLNGRFRTWYKWRFGSTPRIRLIWRKAMNLRKSWKTRKNKKKCYGVNCEKNNRSWPFLTFLFEYFRMPKKFRKISSVRTIMVNGKRKHKATINSIVRSSHKGEMKSKQQQQNRLVKNLRKSLWFAHWIAKKAKRT